jgi:hypothetical protein
MDWDEASASIHLSCQGAVIGVSLGAGKVSRNSPPGGTKPQVRKFYRRKFSAMPLDSYLLAQGRLRQAIRLRIIFARDVGN